MRRTVLILALAASAARILGAQSEKIDYQMLGRIRERAGDRRLRKTQFAYRLLRGVEHSLLRHAHALHRDVRREAEPLFFCECKPLDSTTLVFAAPRRARLLTDPV